MPLRNKGKTPPKVYPPRQPLEMEKESRVWTRYRQWMGNLIPMGLALVTAFTVAFAAKFVLEDLAYWAAIVTVTLVVTILSVNRFGLFQNEQMKRETLAALAKQSSSIPTQRHFVGIARPGFVGPLDPHQDVGFLWWDEERMYFRSAVNSITVTRMNVSRTALSANIHSLIGLGGWVSVTAKMGSTDQSFFFELRDAQVLFKNNRQRKVIFRELLAWKSSPKLSLK